MHEGKKNNIKEKKVEDMLSEINDLVSAMKSACKRY
jgi:hypothetical protein